MRKPTVLTNCAQPVYGLGFRSNNGLSLYADTNNQPSLPVYETTVYTPAKPIFVLGFVHAFFVLLVSVTDGFVHIIHRTNKDHNKLKVIINS